MNKHIFIIVIIFLLASCSSYLNNNAKIPLKEESIIEGDDVINNDIDVLYNNITFNLNNLNEYSYSNDLLNISISFNGDTYKPLSKEELIDNYLLPSNYYEDEYMEDVFAVDGVYYDALFINTTDKTGIIISLSKPGKINYKDIIKQYSDSNLNEEEIKEYEELGYSSISIKIDEYDLFEDDKSVIVSKSYKDLDNNLFYQTTIYYPNNDYLGIIDIISLNSNCSNEILSQFKKTK